MSTFFMNVPYFASAFAVIYNYHIESMNQCFLQFESNQATLLFGGGSHDLLKLTFFSGNEPNF